MSRLLASELDDYSRFAVELILRRCPHWEAFASLEPRADGTAFAQFNIPCPSRGTEVGLWVSTADEELTVGFHTHHRHFTDYGCRCEPKQVEAGLDYAAAIMAERLGVVSWYRGDEFVASVSAELPLPGPLPRVVRKANRGTLRSWGGRFDREEEGAEPRADT